MLYISQISDILERRTRGLDDGGFAKIILAIYSNFLVMKDEGSR